MFTGPLLVGLFCNKDLYGFGFSCAAVKGKILGDMIDQWMKAMSCTMREARETSTAKCVDRSAAEQ